MVLNTFRNSPWSFRNSSAKLTEIPFKEAKGPLKVYHRIIHFNRVVHCKAKPSYWGTPHLWKPPYDIAYNLNISPEPNRSNGPWSYRQATMALANWPAARAWAAPSTWMSNLEPMTAGADPGNKWGWDSIGVQDIITSYYIIIWTSIGLGFCEHCHPTLVVF